MAATSKSAGLPPRAPQPSKTRLVESLTTRSPCSTATGIAKPEAFTLNRADPNLSCTSCSPNNKTQEKTIPEATHPALFTQMAQRRQCLLDLQNLPSTESAPIPSKPLKYRKRSVGEMESQIFSAEPSQTAEIIKKQCPQENKLSPPKSESALETPSPTRAELLANIAKEKFKNWKVGSRYTVRRVIGHGSYGEVAEGFDNSSDCKVAIKRINRLFDQEMDEKRILREIYILRNMSHGQIIRLLDVVPGTSSSASLVELYLVFQFMDTDLQKLIASHQYLSTEHIQTFMYQMLVALKYIHSAHVIHRDIKPANILLNEDCALRICDFGLARVVHEWHLNTRVSEPLIGTLLTRGESESSDSSGIDSVDAPPPFSSLYPEINCTCQGTSQTCILKDTTSSGESPLKRTCHQIVDIKPVPDNELMKPPEHFVRGRLALGKNQPPAVKIMTGAQDLHVGKAEISAQKKVAKTEESFPTPLALKRQLTKHVVTRWYRAPELILLQDYTSAVDTWALGCIFAELLSMQQESIKNFKDRAPLFPGKSCFPLSADKPTTYKDKLDQLNVIFDVIGTPSADDIESLGEVKKYLVRLSHKSPKDLAALYPGAPSEAIDLLRCMLRFDPSKRITVEEALNHSYLSPVRKPEQEVIAENPICLDFENTKMTRDELKGRIQEEIVHFLCDVNLNNEGHQMSGSTCL